MIKLECLDYRTVTGNLYGSLVYGARPDYWTKVQSHRRILRHTETRGEVRRRISGCLSDYRERDQWRFPGTIFSLYGQYISMKHLTLRYL